MQVIGDYKRFWGSNEWDIKVDFDYEKAKTITFTKLTVEFKNNKNGLFNSFEVYDLHSCVALMKKFGEGSGISVFDRRVANWLAEYFTEKSVDVDANEILRYFKSQIEEKVDVRVKKLTFVNKNFTDILDYNEDDLLIDFNPFYTNENWIEGEKNEFNFPLTSNIVYGNKKKIKTDYTTKEIINTYDGTIELNNELFNDKATVLSDVIIEETIEFEFRPSKVIASLIAPDKTVLGVFQPLDMKKNTSGLKIVWKIDELKINHKIRINYILKQRIPFILNLKSENNTIMSYIKFLESNTGESNRFLITVPAMTEINIFSRSKVVSMSALLPIEFTTQEILYIFPHFIVKISDQGNFQRISFSELFVDAIFFDQVRLGGVVLPVITVYESLLPKIGSKLTKKIIRYHSFSNPIITYSLESSANEIIEIKEDYPEKTQIQLLSIGSQSPEEILKNAENSKTIKFLLTANNNSFTYYLEGNPVKDLEKALKSIKMLNKDIEIEISQSINIETIVDKSNKFFIEFMQSKYYENFNGDKIRLRAFNLKILEKNQSLETTTNSNELDLAFEALKNTQSLENLKTKIAASYSTKFQTPENQPALPNGPAIVSQSATIPQKVAQVEAEQSDFSNEDVEQTLLEMEKSYNATSSDVETTEMSSEEMKELNEFIHDYEEQSNTKDEKTSNASQEEQAFLNELASQTIESEIKEENFALETTPKKKNKQEFKKEETKPSQNVEPEKKTQTKEKAKKKVIENKSVEFFIINENVQGQKNPQFINESLNNVLLIGQDQKRDETEVIDIIPEKIYFKIPTKERFLILVLNPKEELSSHIYGRWKKDSNQKYKILLTVVSGPYHVRLQLLESGRMFDLNFKIN